jgi:hypothetical protein
MRNTICSQPSSASEPVVEHDFGLDPPAHLCAASAGTTPTMALPMRPARTTDEILTYKYVKPRDQWVLTEETPHRPLRDRPRARGLYPSGTLVRTFRRRNLTKPVHGAVPAQELKGSPKPQASD